LSSGINNSSVLAKLSLPKVAVVMLGDASTTIAIDVIS
jgi:hypothetical protein